MKHQDQSQGVCTARYMCRTQCLAHKLCAWPVSCENSLRVQADAREHVRATTVL